MMLSRNFYIFMVLLGGLYFLSACESPRSEQGDLDSLLFATEIISFEEGDGAGFGQEELPEIALGPPGKSSQSQGSLDVVSLGVGGSIIVGFGDRSIVDGPGPDFIVFENAFWPGGNERNVWAELGEVSVSSDGVDWVVFSCTAEGTEAGTYPGCAGWTPTRSFDALSLFELSPDIVGGDAFDLAETGLKEARYVRIVDLGSDAIPPSAGFDFDAVGLINWGVITTDANEP